VARVAKTQGRYGEVAVELHTHAPDRLQPGMRLFALLADGHRRELKIENLWPHKQYLVLKFAGIDSLDDTAELVGQELQVPATERAPLEPGAIYVSDLIGCVIFERDRRIGAIQDVRFGAGEAPLTRKNFWLVSILSRNGLICACPTGCWK
jgi:16S rRNA processing protein RimM